MTKNEARKKLEEIRGKILGILPQWLYDCTDGEYVSREDATDAILRTAISDLLIDGEWRIGDLLEGE